jgi:excisionase family DNA binding protein
VTETLTQAQVAEVLGVHIATVGRMLKRGELAAFHVGRCVRIAKADVVALRKSQRWTLRTKKEAPTHE